MKKLFYLVLLFILCIGLSPVLADDNRKLSNKDGSTEEVHVDDIDGSNTLGEDDDSGSLRQANLEKRKNSKKKKGQNKIIIPPNDENVVLELDEN